MLYRDIIIYRGQNNIDSKLTKQRSIQLYTPKAVADPGFNLRGWGYVVVENLRACIKFR